MEHPAELRYIATPTALKFHADTSRVRLLRGPFGSGKTMMASYELYRLAKLASKTRFCIIRNTYRELLDSTQKTFFELFPPELFGMHNQQRQTFDMQFKTQNKPQDAKAQVIAQQHHAEVFFRSFDRPEDVRHAFGTEISGAFIDEAREIPRQVKQMLRPRLRFPTDFPQFSLILATNPPDIGHWIHRDFETHPLPGHAQFFCPPEENRINLPPNYYEDLVEEHRDDPTWIDVYVKGNYGFVYDGTPIYPDFNYQSHVAKKRLYPVKGVPILFGWDYNLLGFCCAMTQLLPRNWIIFDELIGGEIVSNFDTFVDYVVEYVSVNYPGFTIYDFGGHEGNIRSATDGLACVDILKRKGFNPTMGAITEVERQTAVTRQLQRMVGGQPFLQVSPQCMTIIKGFKGGYHRKELKPGMYSEKVDKNVYSHIQDALQAIATRIFPTNPTMKRREVRRVYENERGRSAITGL